AVLDGVGEEVHEDLLETRRVADDADGAGGRDVPLQLLITAVGIWKHRVDRALQDACEIEAIAPKLDLAEADARGVHQIVDQLRELADLAADHVHAPLPLVFEAWRA